MTTITPSSKALAGLWSSQGLPNHREKAPRAISSMLTSQFPQGICPDLPLPLWPPQSLPPMTMLVAASIASDCLKRLSPVPAVPFPARCQGLEAPRHVGKALSCYQGKYSSWSFCLRHPSLCCPDHVSRVWGRKKDQ